MTQPSPSATDKHLALVDEIRRIRESKTVAFKRPATRLKTTIAGLNGQPQPLTLRYYQVVGTFNLLKLRRMLLGDGTGLGKCEVGSTLLLTSQGLRPIETLAPASLDRASSPDEGFYDMDHQVDVWTGRRMAKVSRFYWSGKKPTLKVTTRNGYQFEGTLVHPMRVRDEGGEAWKELRWVREGDFLCVGRSEAPFPQEDPRITFDAAALSTNAKTYTYPTILTPELATLLGYIVAEGHSRKYGVTVTQFRDLNPEPHEEIRDLFQSAFGWEGNYHDLERDTAIKVPSIGIREFLRTLGIGDELSRTKSVPDVVLRGTRESVRGFLSALIESEGSVADGGGVEFSSSSETLARQTQLLLLRFGVISTLSEKHIKGNDHTYWRLTFFGDDARLYQERVGFRSSRKGDDLRASLAKTSNPNKDLVPHAQEPVRALKARILDVSSRSGANDRRKGSGIKQFGETFQSTLKHILLGHRNPSYSWLVKLLGVSHELGLSTSPEYEAVLALVRDRHFYDPVVKIEPGEAEVMDIEVDDPEHCYIANGLLSHNTVQVIAFLCYLWESEHDSKAIVVSPKSALRQWKSEIERFSTGIKSFVVSGSAEERKAIYEAFLEHPTGPDAEKAVLILNYHILVRDWTAGSVKPRLPDGQPDPKQPASPGLLDGLLAKLKNPIVIYDECFDYHTPIVLADGSTELIGHIVTKKLPVEVLSWNWATNQVESKKIVGWYRNPLRLGSRETMLKVQSRFSGTVNVTKSHKFYRVDGSKILANALKKGSETATLVRVAPSLAQEQIILGGMLGDASISHGDRHLWGVVFCQSAKQEAYLQFKRQVLSTLGISELSRYQTEFQSGDQGMIRFRLDGNAYVTSTLQECGLLREGRKSITPDLLDRLTPLGLAIWYGDDGSLDEHICKDGTISRYIVLNTQGFTRAENELLAGYLRWKWGVSARVKKASSKKRGSTYYTLYLDNKAATKFLALLPGAPPGVGYKYPGLPLLQIENTQPRQVIVKDEVVSVEPWLPADKPGLKNRYVYDIEVEDNHNYFANGALVSNCTAFKNPSTKTWQVCRFLADRANRVYGLTATLLKNKLMEGFSIYKVIVPEVFKSKTAFMNDYCVTKLQSIAGSNRKIPIVVGYKNLAAFRAKIDLYFLGRPKHVVSDELPKLITKEVTCVMSKAEDAKYKQALSGVLEMGDGEVKDYEEHKAFVALTYCQQVVDSLSLLKFKDGDVIEDFLFDESVKVDGLGSKEQALVDLITEEFDEEKVIVYTRFASLVPRLREILKNEGIKSVEISGNVKDTATNPRRQQAQEAFQDQESDVRVIIITDAGSEAINLQAASAIIFYDSPWSWGNYVQLLGRPIRIGSPHQHVVAVHIVAERPRDAKKDRKTIDHYTIELLQRKKDLVDKVLGESAVGALDFGTGKSFQAELIENLRTGK